jgi:hypothetical protein
MFRHGRTVTVVRESPGGFDEYGDPTPGYTVEHELDGVGWAPRVQGAGKASGDIEDRGREGVIVGLTLYAPYGSDLLHTDQIRIDDVLYKVEGQPGSWWNPHTGREPGMEIQLSRSEG